jgi:hypothetical protein
MAGPAPRPGGGGARPRPPAADGAARDSFAVEPAVLVERSDTTRVILPRTARASVPFEAAVITWAGGCTRERARTDVRVAGLAAEVRPYNLRRVANRCTADGLYLRHRATLRFDAPGRAVVRFVGLREGPPADSSGPSYTRPAVLAYTVVVTAGEP